jgi:hypothetical protein
MKHLKKYKLFESVDSDLEDIKDIMNDISDMEDIMVDIEMNHLEIFSNNRIDIFVNILPIKPGTKGAFTINDNIKSTIQRLNRLYKEEYIILYQYFTLNPARWVKFYVYDDERGLRDYDTVRMDGSGKYPAPKIYRMTISMFKK